jgi:hypothetical protein
MSEVARGLSQLAIPTETMSWLERAVGESDKTEAGACEQSLKQLRTERDRLQGRIETMYLDRLDGRISAPFFDEKSKEWREQQKQIEARMAQLQTTQRRSAMEAVQTIRSVSDACGSFQERQPQKQRALVSLMEKATWKAEKFEWVLKSPFQFLVHSNSASQRNERGKPGSGQEIEIWLPKKNPNPKCQMENLSEEGFSRC